MVHSSVCYDCYDWLKHLWEWFFNSHLKKLQKQSKLILPLGGDSDVGSESDDDTRLLEEGTVTLPVGTGKL